MGLDQLVAKIPRGSSRLRLGIVATVDGARLVNVDGNLLKPSSWADPMVVDDGDAVTVEISSSGIGGGRVNVQSRATSEPRPRTGTVTQVPAGSNTITVEANGISYPTEPANGPYAVGDKVHFDWGAGKPRALGKVALTAAAIVEPKKFAPAPPKPRATTGKTSAAARSSRTRGPNGWGTHAGDGAKVYQGTYGGVITTGAWFYGTPLKGLNDGRKITRIQFRTGAHLNVGAYGSKTFHFYAHTHASQPGGDTNRVSGPHDVSIPQGAAPRWIDLPLSFAAHLLAGGGIAVAGDPYAAMQGRTSSSPDSGALILHWER